MKPVISICIPAYNRVTYLQRLLQSIRMQTFSSFEVIVSDDSSNNSVKELLTEYADLNIQYYKNSPAAGTPANWNAAITRAKGEWIKLMHDDDWFATADALQKFAEAAINSNADFIFSACTYVSDKKKKTSVLNGNSLNELKNDHFLLIHDNIIGHPSVVMHRKDDTVLYDTTYKWLVDIDFYIRYLKNHSSFFYINEPLVCIGVSESQVSANCYKNPAIEIPEYLSLISKLTTEQGKNNKYVFYSLWNLIKKFKIKKIEELQQHHSGDIPHETRYIIDYQRRLPRIILKQTPASKYFMKRAWKTIKDS